MNSSYPSKAAFIFDVPEPSGISAKFRYRYFQRDEKISDNTKGTDSEFRRHGQSYARDILIEFSPATSTIGIGTGQKKLQFTSAEKTKIFLENISAISNELSVGSRAYTTVIVQDPTANAALQYAIENSLAVNKKPSAGLSPIQKVLKYGSLPTEVDTQSLLDYTDVDATNEYSTFDPVTGDVVSKVGEGDVGKLAFSLTINNKFISDVAIRSQKAALSPIFDSIEPILSSANSISQSSASSDKSSVIEIDDFEPSTTPVSTTVLDVDTMSVYGNTLLGYLITKQIVNQDGTVQDLASFAVTNPSQASFVDTAIIYGQRYRYSIQSVYLVRILSYDGSDLISSDYLISSRQSPFSEVLCEEAKPPPHPVDLRFWFTQEKKFYIEWQHPFNRQEDVKRYQVFRRRSISEPFQLIAELDFDDSAVKTPRAEKIPNQSKLAYQYPTATFYDKSFGLDSDYIYSVCSVDARDLSSGYSEQFRVTFQREYAKLKVERIASAGAPKPYPNFTLDRPLTVDSIKTSGSSKLKVYFDPDYLQVLDIKEKDLGHLATSPDSPTYSVQMINVDLQQDSKVSFSVVDKR